MTDWMSKNDKACCMLHVDNVWSGVSTAETVEVLLQFLEANEKKSALQISETLNNGSLADALTLNDYLLWPCHCLGI